MLRFGVRTGRISDWVLKGAAQDPRIKVTAVCSRTTADADDAALKRLLVTSAFRWTSFRGCLFFIGIFPARKTAHFLAAVHFALTSKKRGLFFGS